MRIWWPLVAVCLGSAVFLLDTTVVTVALPAIGRDLGVPVPTLEWVAGGYPLVLAVLIPSAGALADRIGQRRAYLCGCAVFAVSSLACALAPTAGTLVTARIVQGVGGAALAVGGFALLAASYPEPRRRTAIGVFFAVNSLAAALGPVVGGLLTDGAGWRWVFLLNLPLLALTAFATLAIPAGTGRAGGRFDVAGTVLFALAAGGATAGLTRAAADGVDAGTVGMLAVAALAAAAFVAVERRRDGVLDVRLLATASFGGAVAAAAATSIVFAALLYTSVAMQDVLDPAAAGLALTPFAVASAVTSTAVRRVPPWAAVGGGLLVIAVGCAALELNLTLGLVVSGIGFGLAGPAVAAAVFGAAPPERAGAASAAMATARQLGHVLGIAVLGVAYATGGTAAVAGLAAALTALAGLAALRALRPHPTPSRTTLS